MHASDTVQDGDRLDDVDDDEGEVPRKDVR